MTSDKYGFEGQFLISMPQMNDPNFDKTVVLICEHSQTGAMGLVVNRPTDLFLVELLEQLEVQAPDVKTPVYFGGPVQIERGFVLHRGEQAWQSSLEVADELVVTGSKDILQAIAEGDGPEEYMVALGYAGWGAGQLEQEVNHNYWLTAPANADLIFRQPFERRYDLALQALGVDIGQLSTQAGHD